MLTYAYNSSLGLLTPSESGSESEKDQRINDKHQRQFPLSLGVNAPLNLIVLSDYEFLNVVERNGLFKVSDNQCRFYTSCLLCFRIFVRYIP